MKETLARRRRMGIVSPAPIARLVRGRAPALLFPKEFADPHLRSVPFCSKHHLTMGASNRAAVLSAVAKHAGVDVEEMVFGGATRRLLRARNVACWVCYHVFPQSSLTMVASMVNRHHSTVKHSLSMVMDSLDDEWQVINGVLGEFALSHGPCRVEPH